MAVLSEASLRRALAAAWWGALALGVAVFAAVAWSTLGYPHEVVISEGAVRLAVESILAGQPAYDPSRWTVPPFVIVHYTPLYYWMTALVTKALGAGFFPGRLVSIVFTTATAIVAALLVRRESGRLAPALAAGALWLSFYPVVFWGTAHRVDAPGIFFEACGLLVWSRARREGRIGWGAAPLFVAAWATKQVMIVGAVAAALDCALDRSRGPRTALRWGASVLVPILALFSFWTLWSRGGFWTATVLGTVSHHADAPWVIVSNAERFFGSPWNVLTFLGAAAAGWLLPSARFLALYLGVGIVAAFATDANFPRFFHPMLGAALLVPLLLEHTARHKRIHVLVLFALVVAGTGHLAYEMRPLVRERVLQLTQDNDRIRLARLVTACTPGHGPILAQDVGMLMTAGRPVTMGDPLVFSILVGNGAWDPEILARGLRERAYEGVVLNRPMDTLNDAEWTTMWISRGAREALREHYCLAGTAASRQSWVFLEPERYLYLPRDRDDRCPESCLP